MYRGFKVKDFLVVRNENGETLEILEFDSLQEAESAKAMRISRGHKGDLVVCFAPSLESLLKTYTEYRPTNWKELIKKS